ncbi:hypothetical protein K438DRAFT_1595651 [Mycena galopus ATCC 62051]|nr:hypothetical protein K438DRAFT_1595651 [Mycena galopus ATCC 62051]
MLRNSNLHGYAIPGVAERAIVQLFSDDTTAYLNEQYNFEDLEEILGQWCLASGAKFNASKTEILPFGMENYRKELLTTRRLSPLAKPIPTDVHFAKEGEAVRILGGFVGNSIAFACIGVSIAIPTLDTVDADYARWANLNPTMDMKKNIDRVVAESRTQYLAQVNRILPAVLKQVLNSKRIYE